MYMRTWKKIKSHEGLTRLLTLLFELQLQGVTNFNVLPIEVHGYYCKGNTSMVQFIYVGLDLSRATNFPYRYIVPYVFQKIFPLSKNRGFI